MWEPEPLLLNRQIPNRSRRRAMAVLHAGADFHLIARREWP